MTIAEARSRIDEIDDEIAGLFARRIALVGEIAARKKEGSLPIRDTAREREIVSRLASGRPASVARCVEKLYAAIFEISRERQSDAFNDGAHGAGAGGK